MVREKNVLIYAQFWVKGGGIRVEGKAETFFREEGAILT